MRPVRAKSCFARPLRSTACCARASPLPKRTCGNESGTGGIEDIRGSYCTGDACSEDGPLCQLGLVPKVILSGLVPRSGLRGTHQRNMIGTERVEGTGGYNTANRGKMQRNGSENRNWRRLKEVDGRLLKLRSQTAWREIGPSHYPNRKCIR